MRKLFIMCCTRQEAVNEAPWASKIIKVEGGYMAFECINEYKQEMGQK